MQGIQFDCCGEPREVLHCRQLARGEPGPGQVLVRMLASPVNPSDLMFIRGRYTTTPICPATPGFEGVGVVEQSGGGLRGRLFTGKRVVVLNRTGGNWAEWSVVPAEQVIPVSSRLSDDQAATFFVNPATAWIMTREVLKVPREAWLLQTAAGSSLGRMVVRLGRHCGFRTFNVVRSPRHVEALKQMGADHVEVFDGDQQSAADLRESLRKVIGQPNVGYAIDPVGGATAAAVTDCLASGGHLLLYGTLSNQPVTIGPRTLMTTGSRIEGFWLGNFMSAVNLPFKLLLVRRITNLILSGILSTTIRRSFQLEETVEAVAVGENSSEDGKILLKMQHAESL